MLSHPTFPSCATRMSHSVVLATVFSIPWYKIVTQSSPMLYHRIDYLSLVFSWYTHSPKKAGGYILGKSTSCSWDIARYTIRKLCNFFLTSHLQLFVSSWIVRFFTVLSTLWSWFSAPCGKVYLP